LLIVATTIRTTETITEIIESQYRLAINAIPVWITSDVPEFGGGGVIELGGGSVIVSSSSAAVAKVFLECHIHVTLALTLLSLGS
jgi:hypothetical protein